MICCCNFKQLFLISSYENTMGKSWTTRAQEVWLKERLPEYIKAKSEGKKGDILIQIHNEWFKAFPERSVLFPAKLDDEALSPSEEKLLGDAINQRDAVISSLYFYSIKLTISIDSKSTPGLNGVQERSSATEHCRHWAIPHPCAAS